MRQKAKAAFFISLLLFQFEAASGEECLIIASSLSKLDVSRKYTSTVSKVFAEAGFCVSHIHMPLKRIQKEMKKGRIDGEFLRGARYIQLMSNHVSPVPTPVLQGAGVIVSRKDSRFNPSSLTDVENHSIGYVRGVRWQEALKQNLKNVSRSRGYINLIKKLEAGRIDGLLIDTITLRNMIAKGYLKENEILRSGPVIDLSGYIVLHNKHSNLISELDAALQTLRFGDKK